MVRLLLLLVAGCGNRPVGLLDDVSPPPVIDLAPAALDGAISLDLDTPTIPDQAQPDLQPAGAFHKLGYYRSASTGGIGPSYLDSKLKDGELLLSEWGLAQPPVYCDAKLTALQIQDLLLMAEAVDWKVVDSMKEVGCPSPDGFWSLKVLLHRKETLLLAETSACGNPSGYPPADLQAFLKGVYQVEKDACEQVP